MCGIVGYIGSKDCVDILLDSLSKLEYRGYDSAGIAVIDNEKIAVRKAKGELVNLINKVNNEEVKISGNCGIGHTRWATHGEPSDINSHPHGNERVTIVHNGIIENYIKIKNFLIEKGYKFVSETDTETVAKLLDYYYDGNPIATISKVITEIEGSYALGILFKDFPDTIFSVRKECPLIIGIGENENFIASDVPAILKYTRKYYLLEKDEIATITKDRIDICDIHNIPVKKEVQVAEFDVDAAEKGGYEHFMLKEIYEQPVSVNNTIKPRILDGMPYLEESGFVPELVKDVNRIFIVGCGTAMHAGMIGKYIIEKLARTEVIVDIASEFRYRDPLIKEGDLIILISQSGETADTLEALRLAKRKGAKVMSVVNAKGSSIARESDVVVYTHAGPEISVASTKAYSVQMSVMYLLAFETAYIKGMISKEQCEDYIKQLETIPEMINKTLECREQCQFVASKLLNCDSLLYIGRGLDYAMSMEGSLKLKEISYIHSESYAAGELKHGTISLVTPGMPVIAVATQSDLLEKTMSNAVEVKSRGAMVIMVCAKDSEINEGKVDYIIRVPRINDLFMPMLTIIPLQLVAYYTSLLKGINVDKPRNLAKSVTVE